MKHFFLIMSALLWYSGINAQTLVRGPYLQSVAQESIKILWRTSSPQNSKVDIALEPGGPTLLTVRDTAHVIDHIVLVIGLLPSTTYYYTIGSATEAYNTAGPRYRFTTSNQDGDKVSFWATGDFGSKNQSQIDVRDAFTAYVADVMGSFPDFWMWLGDNVYDDGTDEEFQERIFTPPYGYDSLLTFLPFYPVPGNHDYGSVNMWAPPTQHRGPYFEVVEVFRNGEAGGKPSGTELYYSFDWGNAHFVALNSEAFAYTLFNGTAMEEWFREDLQQSDKLWNIVFWHQPPYSKGSHDSDDFWEILMKAMRQNYNPIAEHFGVDMVICGHSHVYERSNLIKGHFGTSGSYNPETMLIDGDEPYIKYIDGDSANFGTMYIVQGNSGKSEDEAILGHPIFAFESAGSGVCGSLVIEIEGSRLTGKHIKSDGNVIDEFTIIKALRDSSVLTGQLEEAMRNFKVFPNPTRDRINIHFNLSEAIPLDISIFDMAGKVVYTEGSEVFTAGQHQKSYHLNDLRLSTGQYIIRVRRTDGGKSLIQEQVIKVNDAG